MRIVSLQAENFKILKAVEITPDPDGNMVTIGGKNGQGKSSILDAIWVALAGKGVAPPKPIRKGEEECRIRLDLGEYVITRKFVDKGDGKMTDSVKVESGDGSSRKTSPQNFLDDLLGQIGFDPLAFVNRKAEDQAAMLLEMVPLPIDIEEYAANDASDYAIRRDVNRDAESLKSRIAAIPAFDIPENAPDRDALLAQLTKAADHNSAIEIERQARLREADAIESRKITIDAQRERAAALRKEAEEMEAQADMEERAVEERKAAHMGKPPLDSPIDTEAVRAELQSAETTLRQIEGERSRLALIEERKALVDRAQTLTDQMDAREVSRQEALAKAKMPIEGLSFAINEKGKPVVIYQGVPFEQASSADQIRASTAIAMAANPDLRVLRIKDGSLLDDDSMKIIGDMAKAEDFQLWVEVVGTGATGIIIENGEVKAAPADGKLL